MTPPDEPNSSGFVIRTFLNKAAWDKGFRLAREAEGSWLAFDSTTANGRVWLAGDGEHGPWRLASDHPGVLAEFGPGAMAGGPGLATWRFADQADLYEALDRAYKLGASLPDAPLREFERQTAGLPRATEVERLVVQRVGQDVFRAALMDYWDGRCAVTGLADPALLRASHIVRWADCATDAERLDVHNGLLLSALWDAAFDAHLVTFDEEGRAKFGSDISTEARAMLGGEAKMCRTPTPQQRGYLGRHRAFGAVDDGSGLECERFLASEEER
ncbi:MAG: HNH endonuclease [Caulobacteraceae bacterium]